MNVLAFATSLFLALTGIVPGALSTAAGQEPGRYEHHATATVRGKVAYLTFDDGPSAYTSQVLRVLRRNNATATFFQLGVNVPSYPRAQAAIRRQGSNIGNHTYDHADLTKLRRAQIRAEIAGGPTSPCVRPPYGAHNRLVDQVIANHGLRPVLWTADTLDWTRPGTAAILRGALLNLHSGSIILMHDGGGDRSQTVAALPQLLQTLHRRGYAVRALPYC